MRRLPYPLVTCLLIALTVVPGRAAPGAKPKDKSAPLGPITQEQVEESVNNLKQIGLALHNYNDTNGVLPTNQLSADKKPLLSWRVQILPYIEQDHLFRQFNLGEPWDSDHNKKLIEKMPKLFAPPRGKAEPGQTFYQAFTGKRGWLKPQALIPASFPDGTSNTLAIAEAGTAVIWTKPDDLVFDGKDIPALGGMFDGKFHAVRMDGSVARFRKNAPPDALKLLIDPADGMVLPADFGLDEDEKK